MLLKTKSNQVVRTILIFLCGMFIAHSNAQAASSFLPEFVQDWCRKGGIDLCAGEPEEETPQEEKKKPRVFTESEQEILTRLLEKEKSLKAREIALNRRELQLKALEEDIQNQIAQLEKLQEEVEKDIERKKIQDREQFEKAVAFYGKMDPAKASESIAQLNTKTAVQILMKLKDKTSAEILANMDGAQSARLIEEIARKK